MFLSVPLDFQTHEIISQAMGHIGTIATWTDNRHCKSRILLKCKVTRVSGIPCSMIICEGNPPGDGGNSWTVLVFVLSSQLNDVAARDEDQIPINGNPHSEQVQAQNNNQENPIQGNFEDAGDLNKVSRKMKTMAGKCHSLLHRPIMWTGLPGLIRMERWLGKMNLLQWKILLTLLMKMLLQLV